MFDIIIDIFEIAVMICCIVEEIIKMTKTDK